jgi:type II secretory pathway pseudopilin PulG
LFSDKNRRTKNGFGLLEVLISSAILILVSGAVISLNNISVKNTVVASERTQAYNLAREWKELLKQVRDTNVNDNNSATCFSASLNPGCTEIPNSGMYIFNSNQLEGSSDGEDKPLNGVTFNRKIEFETPSGELATKFLETNPDINTETQVREAIIKVSWTEYGKDWSIEVPVLLTNWTAV